jgi:hypothetical protein
MLSVAPTNDVDKLPYPSYDVRQLLLRVVHKKGKEIPMLVPSTRRPLVRTTIDLQLERPDRGGAGVFRGWGVSLSDRLPF